MAVFNFENLYCVFPDDEIRTPCCIDPPILGLAYPHQIHFDELVEKVPFYDFQIGLLSLSFYHPVA